MRIAFVAAGAGNEYCGACHRDAALAVGLRREGHDVLFLPFYTRLVVDGEDPTDGPLFCGGINAYLQQALPFFRETPPWLDRLWDADLLLRFASRFAVKTRPEDLGEMTVSVLKGEQGFQRKELKRLVEHLSNRSGLDAVYLTNSLLSGLAPMIGESLRLPVLCGLQGEEEFLFRLKESHRNEAREWLQRNCREIRQFHAPHAAYAAKMALFLGVPGDKCRVVPPCVDGSLYPARDKASPEAGQRQGEEGKRFRVGFVGRLSPEKGLSLLAEALAGAGAVEREAKASSSPAWGLAVAGTGSPAASREHLSQVERLLAEAGRRQEIEFWGEVSLREKVRLLHSCDVFCQPSLFPEQRAMASLEALSCGVPVAAPATGIFPELAQRTQAVALYEQGNASDLRRSIEAVCGRLPEWAERGQIGSRVVRDRYSLAAAVGAFVDAAEEVISPR